MAPRSSDSQNRAREAGPGPFLLETLRSPEKLLDRLILAVVLGPPRALEGRLRRRPGPRRPRGRW